MTRILVLYGTTDGHTAKIAGRLGDMLRTRGSRLTSSTRRGQAAPGPYGGVIVAGSVHTGGYQPELRQWVRAHAPALGGVPTAFISVCLGVLQREPAVQQEVAATIQRFLTSANWKPSTTRAVAGAVLYTQYGWLERWVMRRIVRKAGGDTDTSRDYDTPTGPIRSVRRVLCRAGGTTRPCSLTSPQ